MRIAEIKGLTLTGEIEVELCANGRSFITELGTLESLRAFCKANNYVLTFPVLR